MSNAHSTHTYKGEGREEEEVISLLLPPLLVKHFVHFKMVYVFLLKDVQIKGNL